MKLPLHLLLPNIDGIPVLMYHKVWPGQNDRLSISPERLKEHFGFLKKEGYQSLHLQDFLAIASGQKPKPQKAFLLTFDDGYVNNLEFAYPIIQSFAFKATFFIIGNTVDASAAKEQALVDEKMTLSELLQLDEQTIQLAMHSYNHIHFRNSSLALIKEDLKKNMAVFEAAKLPFYKVLAYPFGGRCKRRADKVLLQQWMKQNAIEAAFRIGNKPCKVPANDMFELKRIDIWGTDTLADLSTKIRKGKLKPF